MRVRGSRRSPTDTKVILLLAQYQRVFFATLFYLPVVSRSLCPFCGTFRFRFFSYLGPVPLYGISSSLLVATSRPKTALGAPASRTMLRALSPFSRTVSLQGPRPCALSFRTCHSHVRFAFGLRALFWGLFFPSCRHKKNNNDNWDLFFPYEVSGPFSLFFPTVSCQGPFPFPVERLMSTFIAPSQVFMSRAEKNGQTQGQEGKTVFPINRKIERNVRIKNNAILILRRTERAEVSSPRKKEILEKKTSNDKVANKVKKPK